MESFSKRLEDEFCSREQSSIRGVAARLTPGRPSGCSLPTAILDHSKRKTICSLFNALEENVRKEHIFSK